MAIRSGIDRLNVYAVIDGGGTVTNLADWDGVAEYEPLGMVLVPALSDVEVGDSYAAGIFTARS